MPALEISGDTRALWKEMCGGVTLCPGDTR
jgi:hypothetical protein